jgi:hypothetical protein
VRHSGFVEDIGEACVSRVELSHPRAHGEEEANQTMTPRISRSLAWLPVIVLLGCASSSRAESNETITAIVGVTVIHPEFDADAARSPNNTIIIVGNRIGAVGPSATTLWIAVTD